MSTVLAPASPLGCAHLWCARREQPWLHTRLSDADGLLLLHQACSHAARLAAHNRQDNSSATSSVITIRSGGRAWHLQNRRQLELRHLPRSRSRARWRAAEPQLCALSLNGCQRVTRLLRQLQARCCWLRGSQAGCQGLPGQHSISGCVVQRNVSLQHWPVSTGAEQLQDVQVPNLSTVLMSCQCVA